MHHKKLMAIGLGWAMCVCATGCRNSDYSQENLAASSGFEIHYSPKENLEAIDHRLFQSATRSIDIAAYSLTDQYLARDLAQAAGRGVRVRIYLDKGQTSGELSREAHYAREMDSTDSREDGQSNGAMHLLSGHRNIEIRVKQSRVLMHLKSYLIDQQILRSGSANFSPSGEKRQDNDLTLTRDSDSVQRFRDNFEIVWARPDNVSLSSESHGD